VARASSTFASAIVAAAVTTAAVASPPAAFAAGRAASPAVRVVAAVGGVAPATVVDALEAAGYRVHVALLPSTYYVSAGARARDLPSLVRALDPAPGSLEAGVLAPLSSGAPVAPGVAAGDPFGGMPDALPPPPRTSTRTRTPGGSLVPIVPPGVPPPSGLAYGTRWDDTSELMVGRVAVPLLFPESDGTIDPNHFDWTPALRDSVVRSAVRGFLKWSLTASTRNLPLTFLVETYPGLAVRYEPIDRPIAQENLWIEDALVPLVGYRGSAVTMATDFANAARARLSAQWATLAFAVQNDTSGTGSFPDGYISHATLGGPYFVTPVNNLKTQSATLDYYFEHEVTHQFWALDEYPANNAWWSCTLTTGYFNRPNWNSSYPSDQYCGQVTVHCLMKGNYPDDFCDFTMQAVGWTDRDGSGVFDLYETRPVVRPDSTQYRAGSGVPITLRGTANEAAFPNDNPFRFGAGDSISVAVIDSIEYRLDNTVWLPIPCGDGACNFGEEPFTLVLPPLTPGHHVVEWRAWNSSGRTALIPTSTIITISGATGPISPPGGLPAAPRVTVRPMPARGSAALVVDGAPGATGTATLVDLAGRNVRSWRITLPSDGHHEWRWDARTESGGTAAAGLYFVVVKLGPKTTTHRVVLLK
jgi:hypothetical protein